MKRKGYHIKQSFSNDFVDKIEELYKKYGEEVFSIQGIANKHLDIVHFSKEFFNKSASNVADVSVDGNANVKEKNIVHYNYENNKALMRLNGLYLMYKYVRDTFSQEDADIALEKVVSGELAVHDLHLFHGIYCYSFNLVHLLFDGMSFFKGGMTIKPPKRSTSFIHLLIQTVAYFSNQLAGAVGLPDVLVILDYFYRKEKGLDYIKGLLEKKDNNELKESKEWGEIKNQFQNIIYSLNYPFRSIQSAFTNVSVMDHGFMKELFKGYKFPDGTSPDIDSSIELSKLFFEYYTEINCKEGMFTFPVMTLAISLDKEGNYIDPDFVDWAAEINSKKALANIFQSEPTSFSSCCRLLNDLTKVGDTGYQNSFGVGGLSVGSIRVVDLNLPRISMLEKKDPNILSKDIDIVHKILYAQRQLIKERIEGGYLPLYKTGWMSLRRQYSTVGILGANEYVKNKGKDIREESGMKCLKRVLKTIEDNIKNWQEDEKKERNIYNIEQVPGESMAIRLAEIDRVIGFNDKYELYSNQYIPLIENGSIYDRIKIQGELDQYTSGGAILHINVDDEKPISKEQFKKIMEVSRQKGVKYFAINYAYSECGAGHFTIGKEEVCPICGNAIIEQYSRVVGFIVPVQAWNKTRREYEYPNRVFYSNGNLDLNKEVKEINKQTTYA